MLHCYCPMSFAGTFLDLGSQFYLTYLECDQMSNNVQTVVKKQDFALLITDTFLSFKKWVLY